MVSRVKNLLSTLSPLDIPIHTHRSLPRRFTLFPRLPPEIRDAIWRYAARVPRKVVLISEMDRYGIPFNSNITGQVRNPGIMQACRESRVIGLCFYRFLVEIRRPCMVKCQQCRFVSMAKSDCDNPHYFQYWYDGLAFDKIDPRAQAIIHANGGRRPKHVRSPERKENYHWVNYETDEFTLRLVGDRGYYRGLNFNFCLGNLLDVSHLSYRLSPDSLGTWTTILLLKDMIQLLKPETFRYVIVDQDREKIGKD